MGPPKSRRSLNLHESSVEDPLEGVSFLGSQDSRGSRGSRSSSSLSSSRGRAFEDRMLGCMQRIFTQLEIVAGHLEEVVIVQQRQEEALRKLQLQGEGAAPERSSKKTIAGHFIRKRPLSDDEELAKFCDDLQDPDFFSDMVNLFFLFYSSLPSILHYLLLLLLEMTADFYMACMFLCYSLGSCLSGLDLADPYS